MFSALVLGIFALLAVAVALNGFMLSYMWEWFVVPLGVRSIGVVQAVGIAITVSILTYEGHDSNGESTDALTKVLIRVAAKLVAFGIAFGLSFWVPA